jgi:hypothetical protein
VGLNRADPREGQIVKVDLDWLSLCGALLPFWSRRKGRLGLLLVDENINGSRGGSRRGG